MKFKLSATAVAIAAAVLSTSAFADIKIGLVGPLTGGSAPFGVSASNGAKLAVEEINKAGGINGEKIVLIERDDEAKPERGPLIVQEFIAQNVVAITGFTNFGVARPSAKVAQDAGVPLMINVSAGTGLTTDYTGEEFNYIFRVTGHDGFQSRRMANYAVEKFGKGVKVAMMGDTTAYGQGGTRDVTTALASLGVTPVVTDKFNIKDTDMTAQVLRAKQAGAQVILAYGIGPELAALAKTMKKLGFKVPLVVSWGGGLDSFVKLAGKDNAEGVVVPLTFIQSELSTAKQKKFVADYQAAYKVDQIPFAASAAQGYDAIYILAEGIKNAKTRDGKAIVRSLESLTAKIPGIVTTYDAPFSKVRHEAIHEGLVKMRVWQNGQLVNIK
jgi:branched-chain amino acid transport system substrate-binding protein